MFGTSFSFNVTDHGHGVNPAPGVQQRSRPTASDSGPTRSGCADALSRFRRPGERVLHRGGDPRGQRGAGRAGSRRVGPAPRAWPAARDRLSNRSCGWLATPPSPPRHPRPVDEAARGLRADHRDHRPTIRHVDL